MTLSGFEVERALKEVRAWQRAVRNNEVVVALPIGLLDQIDVLLEALSGVTVVEAWR